uniref:Uncharacterized protein n=1 Tax=Arion vulgaris TaxID=1028688 RepID=A0A0B7BHW7_9EUPU
MLFSLGPWVSVKDIFGCTCCIYLTSDELFDCHPQIKGYFFLLAISDKGFDRRYVGGEMKVCSVIGYAD